MPDMTSISFHKNFGLCFAHNKLICLLMCLTLTVPACLSVCFIYGIWSQCLRLISRQVTCRKYFFYFCTKIFLVHTVLNSMYLMKTILMKAYIYNIITKLTLKLPITTIIVSLSSACDFKSHFCKLWTQIRLLL